jgi:hypothetical protein
VIKGSRGETDLDPQEGEGYFREVSKQKVVKILLVFGNVCLKYE